MFIPKNYQQTDLEQIKAFIADYPLATIVANVDIKGEIKLESSHIPLYFERSNNHEKDDTCIGYLYGHIAKANPLFKNRLTEACDGSSNQQWLVIFQDTGHYISPNWYPEKAVHHKAVPTWNYRSVHFTVEAEFTSDVADLKEYIGKLTDRQEIIEDMPWSLDDAPESYINGLCKAIVGIKFKIVAVQGQFKLSQDKKSDTKNCIIKHLNNLNTEDARRMARLIEQNYL